MKKENSVFGVIIHYESGLGDEGGDGYGGVVWYGGYGYGYDGCGDGYTMRGLYGGYGAGEGSGCGSEYSAGDGSGGRGW